ncbi:hypothetical protein B0H11DRAFT_2263212 [Mycena galericulata]|nr:hypothetical protein B0H11DRAFT_2263212 [Mycena galericulata]
MFAFVVKSLQWTVVVVIAEFDELSVNTTQLGVAADTAYVLPTLRTAASSLISALLCEAVDDVRRRYEPLLAIKPVDLEKQPQKDLIIHETLPTWGFYAQISDPTHAKRWWNQEYRPEFDICLQSQGIFPERPRCHSELLAFDSEYCSGFELVSFPSFQSHGNIEVPILPGKTLVSMVSRVPIVSTTILFHIFDPLAFLTCSVISHAVRVLPPEELFLSSLSYQTRILQDLDLQSLPDNILFAVSAFAGPTTSKPQSGQVPSPEVSNINWTAGHLLLYEFRFFQNSSGAYWSCLEISFFFSERRTAANRLEAFRACNYPFLANTEFRYVGNCAGVRGGRGKFAAVGRVRLGAGASNHKPIVTGNSVLAIEFKDVMMAADNLALLTPAHDIFDDFDRCGPRVRLSRNRSCISSVIFQYAVRCHVVAPTDAHTRLPTQRIECAHMILVPEQPLDVPGGGIDLEESLLDLGHLALRFIEACVCGRTLRTLGRATFHLHSASSSAALLLTWDFAASSPQHQHQPHPSQHTPYPYPPPAPAKLHLPTNPHPRAWPWPVWLMYVAARDTRAMETESRIPPTALAYFEHGSVRASSTAAPGFWLSGSIPAGSCSLAPLPMHAFNVVTSDGDESGELLHVDRTRWHLSPHILFLLEF